MITSRYVWRLAKLFDLPPKTGDIRTHTEVKDNDWVVIQISDHGKNIPKQILPKLFDLF